MSDLPGTLDPEEPVVWPALGDTYAAAAIANFVGEVIGNKMSSMQDWAVTAGNIGLAAIAALGLEDLLLKPQVADVELDEEIISTDLRPTWLPIAAPLTWNNIPDPPKPGYEVISVPEPDIPGLEIPSIGITIPGTPVITYPAPLDGPPTITDPDPVDRPIIEYPPEPTLEFLTLPDVPSITVPEFNAQLDELIIDEPVINITPGDLEYDSVLMNAVRDHLFNSIVNQGTGINPEIEAALFDREQERAELARQESQDNIASQWAAKGFSLPDGALAAALLNIETEYQNKRLDVSRDILIKAWELEQGNIKHAVEQAVILENNLMNWCNEAAKRQLEASKAIVAAAIDIYKAKISKYSADVEAFKARAVAYEAQIRGILAVVDIYKAEVDAVKVAAEIQQIRVEIYKALLGAVEIRVKVYQADLEARKIFLDTERLRIDVYKAQIDAFIAQINGETAKVNLYSAQISGEKAKADLYGSEVDAYKTRVEAAKLSYSALVEGINAKVETNKSLVQEYQADVELYKNKVLSESSRLDSIVKKYGADVEVFKADVSMYDATARLDVQILQGRIEQNKNKADVYLKDAELTMRSYEAINALKVEALKQVGSISAQIAASALAGFSVSTSMGASGSFTSGESHSYGTSVSHSDTYDRTKGVSTVNYSHQLDDTKSQPSGLTTSHIYQGTL